MSGHSKWSTIKRKKGALDAKRGKIFTKLIKEISVAVKEGGSDPEANPRLRLAIQNAKGQNMPKENIERAIKKSSDDGANYEELTYEGYAPFGVAVFVECATDNLNRTVASVRSLFTKYGGSLGVNGSVDYMFERKGIFLIKQTENMDKDDLTLELIDGGAEDAVFNEGYIEVTCAMEDFGNMQSKLDELGLEAETAELQRIPSTTVSLDDEQFEKVMKLIDALEDDDDVQKVYHNLDASESQMESWA
ncbi:YebC/PmpR family DNA-binding transcriptional regulator [Fulvivirga kasyanovii]|uniref:Probable transcriptional regulatory protein E1163_07300 n=1 Tax=Fulvivirga kasyanovii TaxID=396812 RepID=A0ABW9RL84_9BACT|nr:YebC/PmpR family DNA-binding transcriptional regulator [Fulvivirga kasyanovii]MTI24741.1 YebC/PmpR family DNA-binding transcriptional regulator [Fulvivirga kasyanovii]